MLAGRASTGCVDGYGTNVLFAWIFSMAAGPPSAKVLYVTDYLNQVIRRIDLNGDALLTRILYIWFFFYECVTSGTVTTYAGVPSVSGYVDGSRTSAKFRWPVSVAASTSGTLLVADQQQAPLIRSINSIGTTALTAHKFCLVVLLPV